MKKLLNKAKKGFTIVELVVVIGVIAILSAILIPTFINLNSKASAAALQNDLSATYATYTADAADGKEGDPEGSGQKLNLYAQQFIVIFNGTDSYKRGNDGKWVKQNEAPTSYTVYGAGSDAKTDNNGYVVGNYKLYHTALS